MSHPLVSIITPCYNARAFLPQLLACVQRSTYPHWEHIIVDDASIDDSLAYLKTRLEAEPSLFQLRQQDDRQGPAAARNLGVQAAKGEYLLFLDCDDEIPADFITTLVQAASDAPPQTAPFYTAIQLQGEMQRSMGGLPWSIERLVDGPFIHVCSLIPRSAFEQVGGFDEKLRVLEDYDLFLALAIAGYTGHRVPQTRLTYHIRQASYSDHFNQRGGDQVKRRARQYILLKYRSQLEALGLAERPKVQPYLTGQGGAAGEFDLSKAVGSDAPPGSSESSGSSSTSPAQPSSPDSAESGSSEPENVWTMPKLVEAKEQVTIEPLADALLTLIPGDASFVLEVGCGDGSIGAQFKRIAPHANYYGVIVGESESEERENVQGGDLELAIARLDRVVQVERRSLVTADLAALELAPGSIDCLIYAAAVVVADDFAALLQQQRQWLKPEAVVLIASPNPQYWRALVDLLANRDRPRGYLLQELQAIVQQAQLSVIDVRPSEQEATIDPVFERAWAQFWQVPTSETAGETTGEITGEAAGEAATIEPHEATGEATNEATTIEDLSSLGLNQTSLNTSLKIPYYILRAWNSSQLPQRLLVQTLLISTMASDRVRVYQPDRLLNSIPGARTSSSLHQLLLSRGRSDESKVFIWQRARLTRADGIQKQRRILDAGYLTVVEIDDDPRFWQEHIDEDFFTYRSCHCIQTSTEPLADFLRQFNPYVFIMPNQIYELPLPRVYDEAQPVKVFFGALNREEDWQPLMAGINRTLRDLGDRVFVQVVHDKLFYQFLDTPYKGFEATCTYDRYHEILRDCDLALLPLNPTEFNTMKSDLKFIECASRGVVVLASPTVYARSVQHGKTGLLFNTPEEFEVLLHQVIDNRVWRRELAANAYAYVRDRRMISQHYRDRYNWYLEMLDRLPELNAALKERVPEIFADLGI